MQSKVTFSGLPFSKSAIAREKVVAQFSQLAHILAGAQRSQEHNYDIRVVDEIIVRLSKIQENYNKLLETNDKYLGSMTVRPRYDAQREALVMDIDGREQIILKLKRSNPDIPIRVLDSFELTAFTPGDSTRNRPSQSIDEAESELSSALEHFYYASSKLWDLIEKTLLAKSKSSFIGIKMVRNRLIEHSEKGIPNSFGATSVNGPIAKPIRNLNGVEEHFDRGLIPNTEEFLRLSIDRLLKAGL